MAEVTFDLSTNGIKQYEEKESREIEAEKNKIKEEQERKQKTTRAQQAAETALKKKQAKEQEDAEKSNKARESAVLRIKINSYFNSKHIGPILSSIRRPALNATIEELEETLSAIYDCKTAVNASARITAMLDMACFAGDAYWEQLPSPINYNLTGIAPGREYYPIIKRNMEPLIEEVLIEYPKLGYSPLWIRALQSLHFCLKSIDQLNRDPEFKKAMQMASQPPIDIPAPIPKTEGKTK